MGLFSGPTDPYHADQFLGTWQADQSNASDMYGELAKIGGYGAAGLPAALAGQTKATQEYADANDPNTFWNSNRVQSYIANATQGTEQAAANVGANNDLALQQRGLETPATGGDSSIAAGASTANQMNLFGAYANARTQLRNAQIASIPQMYSNQMGAFGNLAGTDSNLAEGGYGGAGAGYSHLADNTGNMYQTAMQGDQSVAQAEGAGWGGLFGGLATLGGAWIGASGGAGAAAAAAAA